MNNLKSARLLLNLTQEEIAKLANIPLASYRNYESGKTEPNVLEAIKLAHVLNSRVDDLFWEDRNEPR